MNSEPTDLDHDALMSTLSAWDLSVSSLTYLPVGAGSHHYLAVDTDGRRWFVTVDELLSKLYGMFGPTYSPWVEVNLDSGFLALDRAFQTALALRRVGLEFIHAPAAQEDGSVLERLGDYAVSVFPYIDRIADTCPSDGRHRLLGALGRLHAATAALSPDLPQRDGLTVPIRAQLLEALDELDSAWTNGPYGEAARGLLATRVDAIRELCRRCDELAETVRASQAPWVITHGQMHEGNIVFTTDDQLLLVDLDCLAVAPRERDLGTWGNRLDPRSEEDWAAYRSAGQPRSIDPTAVELYRHLGLLWTICADTAVFRSPHVDGGDARHEWRNLQTALSQLEGS